MKSKKKFFYLMLILFLFVFFVLFGLKIINNINEDKPQIFIDIKEDSISKKGAFFTFKYLDKNVRI